MVYCCLPLCDSYHRKNSEIAFHDFPANNDMRSAWLNAISRKDFYPNDKSNSSRVCSKHFKEDDYIPNKKRRCLKRNSVPSIFPSNLSHKISVAGKPSRFSKRHSDQLTYPTTKRKCVDVSCTDIENAELLLNFFETVSRKMNIANVPVNTGLDDINLLLNFPETLSSKENNNKESINLNMEDTELINFSETLSSKKNNNKESINLNMEDTEIINFSEAFFREVSIPTEPINNFKDQESQTKMKMTLVEKLQFENRKRKESNQPYPKQKKKITAKHIAAGQVRVKMG